MLLAIEQEIAAQPLAVEDLQKPEVIILPHFCKRKVVHIEPKRIRFNRRLRLTFKLRCDVHPATQAIAPAKLKMEKPARLRR